MKKKRKEGEKGKNGTKEVDDGRVRSCAWGGWTRALGVLVTHLLISLAGITDCLGERRKGVVGGMG